MSYQQGYLARLDGLRAVAVLLVLWSHIPYIASSGLSKLVFQIGHAARAGYIGVDIFFALSGFLITRLLLEEKETEGAISLPAFYVRRALRIFPIYFLCVLLAQLLAEGRGGIFAALTYTFNFYHPFNPAPHALEHTWSLCVEEHFYLIWPFVLARLPRRYGLIVTGLVVPALSLTAAVLIAASFNGPLAADLIYMSTPTRILSLSLGASLAFEERSGNVRSLAWAVWMLVAAGAILGLTLLARAKGLLAPGGFYWCFALAGYALISRGLLTLAVFETRRWFAPVRTLLEMKPLLAIGRISYGLYLYHYMLLFALGIPDHLTETTGASGGLVLTAWVLTFAIAAASYRYIEAPLLRLKDRYGHRRPAQPAAAVSGGP